jgi:hypothetical protein
MLTSFMWWYVPPAVREPDAGVNIEVDAVARSPQVRGVEDITDELKKITRLVRRIVHQIPGEVKVICGRKLVRPWAYTR